MYADPIHSAGNKRHVPFQSFLNLQLSSSAFTHITSYRESNTSATTVIFVLFESKRTGRIKMEIALLDSLMGHILESELREADWY